VRRWRALLHGCATGMRGRRELSVPGQCVPDGNLRPDHRPLDAMRVHVSYAQPNIQVQTPDLQVAVSPQYSYWQDGWAPSQALPELGGCMGQPVVACPQTHCAEGSVVQPVPPHT
jgi:hypothetical protein